MNAADNRSQIGSYLDSLRTLRKLSGHTVSNYSRDLAELLEFAESVTKDRRLSEITHFHIRKFAAQLHSKELNARSIARKLSCWRGFFDWLSQQGVELPSNPVDGVKAPKRNKPLPKALSADDAVHLVANSAPGHDDNATMQRCNRAMFELLYSSGLRVSELVGLDVRYTKDTSHESQGWIDFDAHEVTVTGKGNKKRIVPVGGAAMNALVDWIAVRGALVKTDATPLFLSERGARMSPRVVQLRLKAHGQSLGMSSSVHPHVLRHSFA